MNELVSYNDIKTVEQLRGALNTELNAAAVSFVRIGYLLKTARDTEILEGSEYTDVNAFAQAEFGLDKSQVSRFIRINDRFSIGGYSEHLKVEYQEYGSAKLSMMLTLPDEINEELSPEFSKADIQAVKEEYDEEQKITDIEVMLEPKAEEPEAGSVDEFIAAVVKELNDEHPEPIERLHFENTAIDLNYLMDDLQEAYMPDGDRVYNIRISGQGRFMVSMKEEGIMIVNMRNPSEKSPLSWNEFMAAVLNDEEHRTFTEPKKEKPKQTEQKKPAKVERSTASKKKDHTGENTDSGDSDLEENGQEASAEEREEITEEKQEGKTEEDQIEDPDPAAGPERVEGEVVNNESKDKEERSVHRLKTLPEYFEPAMNGLKTFELRMDDRDFKIGDLVTLEEWDGEKYTGREVRNRPIKYILRSATEDSDPVSKTTLYGLREGYCILGF